MSGEGQFSSHGVRQSEFDLLHFCSSQAFSGLDDAYSLWVEPSVLLKWPVQLLISSTNTLSYIPEIMLNKISGHPGAQSG